jgi:fatty acid/phospholipid biosynthesis enzyme
MIAGDVNGDGYSNDRAFVYNPSIVADTALASGMRQLLANASPATRDCLQNQIGHIAARLDPRRYNGAMFLGLAGIAVKSHGSTDAFGFANAVGVAVDLKVNGFLQQISDEVARLNTAPSIEKSAAL